MSCCGNKRREWSNNKTSVHQENNTTYKFNSPPADKADIIFEYTGNHQFIVRGIITGRIYKFKFKGDKQEVNYNDSFALRAERDLKCSG